MSQEAADTLSQEMIIGAVSASTAEVFATMLGLEVAAGQAYTEGAPPGPSDGVVSFIGLAGSWAGAGGISCSADFACRLSSQMLMIELAAVDAEVLDAVAEVTNMIFGNVKTSLETRLGPMGLSIPTVVFGKNFSTRTVSQGLWTVIPFHCGPDRLDVKICLTPNRETRGCPRPGFVQHYTLHGQS